MRSIYHNTKKRRKFFCPRSPRSSLLWRCPPSKTCRSVSSCACRKYRSECLYSYTHHSRGSYNIQSHRRSTTSWHTSFCSSSSSLTSLTPRPRPRLQLSEKSSRSRAGTGCQLSSRYGRYPCSSLCTLGGLKHGLRRGLQLVYLDLRRK